jgi:hypothetical protein
MNPLKCLSLAVVLMAGASLPLPAGADHYSPRQYYSSWKKHAKQSYYYRSYYYKPAPTYKGYKHHYAIYYPARPKYVYFYNPYKKAYWGRCQTSYPVNQPKYSTLAEPDRRGNIDDIPEKAFPKPKAMPRIPEAEDGVDMEPPPDDLPERSAMPQ